MTERVDLNDETDLELFVLTELDQPVEDRFPIFVACEVVVGDEERMQSLFDINADDAFDVEGSDFSVAFDDVAMGGESADDETDWRWVVNRLLRFLSRNPVVPRKRPF